ncbi:MAG TPA: serine/threonine-protein kinase [Solirubrobacteraceae bacterium]|nr:serine/threonine-protein kinase [Solirubrobacteraceae bacterium]
MEGAKLSVHTTVEPDERIGTRVGGYEIDSLVGVGTMANVYRARSDDGSSVAVKIVKPDHAADETFRRRFSLEAEIARTISNPHIVQVLDAGEHECLPYVVERFIDGPSLEQELQAKGRLDVATTVRICTEAAEGLQALWEAGMVHRDVKPGNILLDRAGVAHLTDFGLAKNTQGEVLTLPGHTLGTLNYMAPEQIRGDPVTGAADVYSLGCVAFECLQGRPPFGDRDGMRVLWAHLQEEPPDPTADVELSPEFVEAMKTALRKEPAERPVSGVAYARSMSLAAGLPAVGGVA